MFKYVSAFSFKILSSGGLSPKTLENGYYDYINSLMS